MIIDFAKSAQIKGRVITTVQTKDGKTKGVVTIPDEGFERLIGMCDDKGTWVWVHKNFRKN